MLLQLPHELHYPIHITAVLKAPDEKVGKYDALVSYKFRTFVEEDDELTDKPNKVEKWYPATWKSPVEGVLKRWMIEAGSVVKSGNVDLVEIEEPCPHDVQFGGMCAGCGMDMTVQDYMSFSNRSRADISMAHDNLAVLVSQDEAARLEAEAEQRLLQARKLSLVVDLDQTIIHATVDPTVAQWQADPDQVNHEVLKDVQSFSLPDPGYISEGHKPLETWYYVKLRPGLRLFLENISKLYELHIYTMGTRAYALNVARIVDPEGKIFGSRVLSRDESGSMTEKDLRRLFPKNTKMVVIIDDRGDVWKWSDNLIRVKPYDFFVGIGDINSSFLPKKQEFPTAPTQALTSDSPGSLPAPTKDGGGENGEVASVDAPDDVPIEGALDSVPENHHADLSTLEQLVKLGASDDKLLLEEQAHQLSDAIRAQQETRPLAKLQHIIDLKDEAEGVLENGESGVDTPSEHGSVKHRHPLIKDEYPRELEPLERNLTEVHRIFYRKYDENMRPRGRRTEKVPDVAALMSRIKKNALDGVVLVFSGVIPLGASVQDSDIAIWARSFGAVIEEILTSRVTHVIAARSRTAKVRQAARYPHIHLVTPQWLYDSFSSWTQMPLDPYRIAVHPEDRNPPGVGLPPELLSDPSNIPMSSEDEDENELAEEEMDIEEHTELLKGGLNLDHDGIAQELAEFLADTDISDEGGDDHEEDEDEDYDILGVKIEKNEESPDINAGKYMRDSRELNGEREDAENNKWVNVKCNAPDGLPQRSPPQSPTRQILQKRSRTPGRDGGGDNVYTSPGSFDSAEDSDDELPKGNSSMKRFAKRPKIAPERQSNPKVVVTTTTLDAPILVSAELEERVTDPSLSDPETANPPQSKEEREEDVTTPLVELNETRNEDSSDVAKGRQGIGDAKENDDVDDLWGESDAGSLFGELDEEAFAAALEEELES